MKRLITVRINNNAVKKKTKDFVIPRICVNLSKTKVMTVTEMAKIVRNPVFMPKIRKRTEKKSPEPEEDRLSKLIFSGEAKRGTLNIAFAKKSANKVNETVLRWFCSFGNRIRIARPIMIPWKMPIPNDAKTTIKEKIGS